MKSLLSILLVFSFSYISAQQSYLQWVFGMGGPGNNPSYVNEVHTIHTAANGEITAGGWGAGTLDLDPSQGTFLLTSPSPTVFNGFFARYDSSRNFLQGYILSCTSDSYVENTARDAAGNIYISGEFIGSMDADPGTGVLTLNSLTGGRDMFIAKYDTAGNPLYAFSLGGDASTDQLNRMLCDGSGDVYITGNISDTVDFDPGPAQFNLNGTAGNSMFLAKYSTTGQLLWAFMIDTAPLPQTGYSLTSAPNGDLLVTIGFRGTIDADPGVGTSTFSAVGTGDLLVARYTPSGTFVGAWQIGGPGGVSISETSISCDPSGSILLSARFTGNLDIDPGTGTTLLNSIGSGSVFAAKYSPSGQLQWGQLAGYSNTGTQSNGFDAQGGAYVLSYNVINQARLTKFSSAGSILYTKELSGGNGLVSRALCVKAVDAFQIGGSVRGSGIIDNAFFGAGGSGYGAFLSQFGACLVPVISNQSGTTVACDSSDVIFTVAATGTGISYQWYLNGNILADDTTAQLTLATVGAGDSGTYTCIVTGLCGADTTAPIVLQVFPPPQMTIQINAGQLLALPTGLSNYVWLYNNQPTSTTGAVYPNPAPGFYAVIGINVNGCADTSALVAITGNNSTDEQQLLIFPNPATTEFTVRAKHLLIKEIKVYGLSGEFPLLERTFQPSKSIKTDISMLAPGTYVLMVETDAGMIKRPLVVVH
jgi:hypothetical protein